MSEATTRPTVDFSGSSRETARAYAKIAWSRTLDPKHQQTLADAGNGFKVDAYALNEAVTAAMRSATTRLGQSYGRRQMATKIAYLGHIAQAVIEAHADSLPAYAEGERSRLVEDLKSGVRVAQTEIERLTAKVHEQQGERATLTQAASDERRRLCAEIDRLRSQAEHQRGIRVGERVSAYQTGRTLDYALSLLDAEGKARVAGFRDGLVTS